MRKIDTIIVHCSASDYAHHDNVETIRDWHVNGNGWSDVGYHRVITKNGRIEQGRPDHRQGAHCKDGNQNGRSIGICLTGSKIFSRAQFESLRKEIATLTDEYGIKYIYPHSHFANKACPNFDLEKVLGIKISEVKPVKKKRIWTRLKAWFLNL